MPEHHIFHFLRAAYRKARISCLVILDSHSSFIGNDRGADLGDVLDHELHAKKVGRLHKTSTWDSRPMKQLHPTAR